MLSAEIVLETRGLLYLHQLGKADNKYREHW